MPLFPFHISGRTFSPRQYPLEKWGHGNSFITQSAALYEKATAFGDLHWGFGHFPPRGPCSQHFCLSLLKVTHPHVCRSQGHHLLFSRPALWHAALHAQRRFVLSSGRRWQVSWFIVCCGFYVFFKSPEFVLALLWCPVLLLLAFLFFLMCSTPCFPPLLSPCTLPHPPSFRQIYSLAFPSLPLIFSVYLAVRRLLPLLLAF